MERRMIIGALLLSVLALMGCSDETKVNGEEAVLLDTNEATEPENAGKGDASEEETAEDTASKEISVKEETSEETSTENSSNEAVKEGSSEEKTTSDASGEMTTGEKTVKTSKAAEADTVTPSANATASSSNTVEANKPRENTVVTTASVAEEATDNASEQTTAPSANVPAPGSAGTHSGQSGETTASSDAGIAVMTKTEAGNNVSYQYPFFVCDNGEYNKVVTDLNRIFEDYKTSDISEGVYYQDVYMVDINEMDKFVYIEICRTQEAGGPHPNNYDETYVISKETKNFAKLSDVFELDDSKIQDAADQVYSAHNDKNYDAIDADVKKAIKNDKVHWRLEGERLVLWFDYGDITGANHGDSPYTATITW